MAPRLPWLSATLAPSLLSLSQLVSSQTSGSPCPGLVNGQYTDGAGVPYTVYCGYDTNTGAYASPIAASFDACMQTCDSAAYPACVSVTFAGGTCYLKNDYTGFKTSTSMVYSAVKCSTAGLVPYPPPTANYVNASSGCGRSIPAGSALGITRTYNYTSPDGRNRTYAINLPSTYDVNKAAPLIFAFHGKGEDATSIESRTGYSTAKWNPYGIAVYPTGLFGVSGMIPLIFQIPLLLTLRGRTLGKEIPIS